MKTNKKLAAVVALALAGAAPSFADEVKQPAATNDPFVSTQGAEGAAFAGLGPVGAATLTAVVVATVVAVADSSTTTTTTN